MNRFFRYLVIVLLVLVLTILTQVGGVAIIMGLVLKRFIRFKYNGALLSLATYLLMTFLIVPIMAQLFGREPIDHTASVKPTSYLTVFLNRNYARPEINKLLNSTAEQLPAGFEIRYLDACFPFMNGFPLLPHLSHNDGRKLDISLMYQDQSGVMINLKPSRTGYGVFVEPAGGEYDQTKACKDLGFFQYDFPKYLTLGAINQDIRFSPKHTAMLINALLKSPYLEKLFVEKHLIVRMNLKDSRIRFQGCQAVRHDDHIHVQVR